MSNKTKRDVFKDVVETLHTMDGAPDDYCKDLIDHYDAALPDDLPMIPKEVGEYIKWGKSYDIQLYMMYSFKFIHSQGFKKLTYDVESWIISNSETFSLAWVLGVWRVEGTGEIVKAEL